MTSKEKQIREQIIKAGHDLIEKKLIARTWGNISARLSPTEFIITPSGRSYEDLEPRELVKVRISDLSYQGRIKPSSEKGIHAEAYRLRNDVNFIIHTHQNYATAISIEQKGQTFAPIAQYALPGTKDLKEKVAEVIKNNKDKNTFLLARHGAIVLGKNYADAFENAEDLERKAKEHFELHPSLKSKKVKPYLDDYAQMMGFGKKPVIKEDEEAILLIKVKNDLAMAYADKVGPMNPFDVMLQHLVYKLKYSKLKDKK